jgi:hypothetical protein
MARWIIRDIGENSNWAEPIYVLIPVAEISPRVIASGALQHAKGLIVEGLHFACRRDEEALLTATLRSTRAAHCTL